MVMTMRMKIGSLILFCGFISSQNLYFTVSDLSENTNIANLKISAKANKLIRDKAYLSFPKADKRFKDKHYSDCWLDFIKNKKIVIHTSENNISFVKKSQNQYTYKINFDPSKINVKNVNENDFLYFCEKNKPKIYKNGGVGGN